MQQNASVLHYFYNFAFLKTQNNGNHMAAIIYPLPDGKVIHEEFEEYLRTYRNLFAEDKEGMFDYLNSLSQEIERYRLKLISETSTPDTKTENRSAKTKKRR